MTKGHLRAATLVAATFMLWGCGGDDPVSPTVSSIVVTASKQTIAVGEAVQLTATALDASGATIGGAQFTYASSAASVVSVSTNGRVIGVSAGTASITASSGGRTSAPLTFTVTPSGVAAVVTMTPNTFTPFTTTIRVGQSVLFDFPPPPAHNVIFAQRTGKPADIPATQSQQVTRTFSTPGTFPYDCTLHPGMRGEVVVNP
jgi:plastocyanin